MWVNVVPGFWGRNQGPVDLGTNVRQDLRGKFSWFSTSSLSTVEHLSVGASWLLSSCERVSE